MVNVVCVKWGDKYSSEYVNNLYSMVSRNLSREFRFVCFTENPEGIKPGVEVFPFEDDYLPGWWNKVSLFKPRLFDLEGTTLYLDLDVVIVDSIDCFFDQPGQFCIIRDWICEMATRRDDMWNSSVFRYEIGDMSHVWNDFKPKWKRVLKKYRWGDQKWITEKIPNATVWDKEWCRSFKWCCSSGDNVSHPIIPSNSKIIVFNGHPKPHEAISGFKKYGPSRWIGEYWK